jgi:Rrf2 family transcriptional regulator, iron-sulfur cluster assembly transcription factor
MITKAAKFGLYAMVMMAKSPGELVSSAAISKRFGISDNHMAKVLQQLARARLVSSVRGSGGGYRLARSARDVTMLDVVETLEGSMLTATCVDCPFRVADDCDADTAACAIHHVLAELKQQTYYTLKSITIAAVVANAERRPDKLVDELVGS